MELNFRGDDFNIGAMDYLFLTDHSVFSNFYI
jgi:hypothetical protein